MKKTFKITLALLLFTIVIGALLVSCNSNSDYEKVASLQTDSNCDPDWFPHNQTPSPKEGDGSPFDTTNTTNSIFHQWSWQKFLWLTKPMENGKTLFEDSLTLVDNQLIPVNAINGVSLVLTDVGQAGSSGILMSNAKFNGQSDTVYYGIYANDILLHVADSMKNVILKDHSQVNNTVTFPVGALEVKTSWVQARTIPSNQLQTYYTAKAYIPSISDTATVALLGMHVVGVVKNHPEFIWATFEHNNMAGYYDWAATTTQDVPVTSDEELLFFAKGYTANITDIKYDSTTLSKPENVFTVFQYGIPRTAGNAFMPNTSQDSESNSSNYNNIVSLNKCVADSLNDVWKNYFYNGSVWLNTDGLSHSAQVAMMIDAGDSVGSAKSGSNARGALAAFNITMETFAQTFGVSEIHSFDSSQVFNCMGCHTAESTVILGTDTFNNSKSPLYFSHLFRSYLSYSSGISKDKIESLRTQEFINLLNAKKDANKK